MYRRYTLILITCTLVYMWISIIEAVNLEYKTTTSNDFDICTQEVFKRSPGWKLKSICNNTTRRRKDLCVNKGMCAKIFRLSVFNQQLFAITMKNTVLNMLTECCGSCARCSVVNEIEHLGNVDSSILNSSDIIFPVIGESAMNKLHGFYFLPAFLAPSSYYCILKKSHDKIVGEVIAAFTNMWPLLIICLLFALISGFIVWVTESQLNVDEFPRPFHVGLFDGFWWSFVSMTTVGFGDKVPKSHLGRIYAVFWILLGITLCSMFTATLTTEIIDARSPTDIEMAGKNIAVLKGRLHDIAIVAQHGGILHTSNIAHTMRGINELITMLENQSIHGFLIDRNTYYHFSQRIKEEKYKYIAEKIRNIDVIRTEKFHKEESLSCGMMVRSLDDFEYFMAYLDNTRLYRRSCNSLRMNTKKTEIGNDTDMFGYNVNFFKYVMYYSLAILGIMVTIGILMEIKRYLSTINK